MREEYQVWSFREIPRMEAVKLRCTPDKGPFITEFDVHGTVHRYCIPLSITNKMQRYTIFFIAVNALHVSGGFSAHHQDLKLHTALPAHPC
jgi:hypothetical protein